MADDRTIVQLTDRVVDLARLTVTHGDGSTGSLTAREGELLGYLAARPEQDVSRDELLTEVWEYRANFATRAVDVAMRRLRAKIEPDPAQPVHLISVHGVGYRFVPPTEMVVAPVATTLAAAASVERTHNLTPDQTSFVGREADLQAVARLFRTGARLVTVVGPGGMGKSRLAQRFARRVFETASPGGGVWFCDLSEAVGLSGVLAPVADALGVPLTGSADADGLTRQLALAIAERGQTLLVLDNFEQVASLAPSTVGRWLAEAPEARFLIASRERLRIPGEATYELGPLAHDDGANLFLDRARASGAEVLPGQQHAIEEIVRRLEGLPLAIELAAPRARILSPDQLLERLDERFKLLRAPTRSRVQRQATLHGTLDWSWDLLDPWERQALAQCAVFAGGFSLEAVEAVVVLDDDAPWALDVVEALRDKSLLKVYEPPDLPGELRFGMFDTIRAYALERLDELDDTDGDPAARACESRHAAYFLAEGERLVEAIHSRGGVEAFRRLALETDNLLAVFRRTQARDPSAAVRAVLILEHVFQTRGPFEVFEELVDKVVHIAQRDAPELLARVLATRAGIAGMRGRPDDARRDLERGLALVDGSGTEDELLLLNGLAMVHAEQSRVHQAAELVERAIHIARQSGLERQEGVLYGLLGAIAIMEDDLPRAEKLLRQSLRVHERVGNLRHQALDWSNLGMVLLDQGRIAEAEEHARRALDIDRRLGNQRRIATSQLSLATIRCQQWRLDEAEELSRDALRIYRSVGYPRFAGIAHMTLATVLLASDRPGEAREHLEQASHIVGDIGDRQSATLAHALLAATCAEQDDPQAARAHLAQADALVEELQHVQGRAFTEVARGFVLLEHARAFQARGQSAEARRATERAEEIRDATLDQRPSSAHRFFQATLERALDRDARRPPDAPF